jgi:hypothetical protein
MPGAPHPEPRIAGDEKATVQRNFKKRGCSAEKTGPVTGTYSGLFRTPFFYESQVFFKFFQDFSAPVLPSCIIQYD